MKILSIGKEIIYKDLDIISISSWESNQDIESYDYIIINGGDGTIRRTLKEIYTFDYIPPLIINPTGSFNVIAKLHRVVSIDKILNSLSKKKKLNIKTHKFYKLNSEVFLFSAGNMGDLQHILLSETLRFGCLEQGILKYILSFISLLPLHILITPFMLLSPQRFFIFTPFSFIKKFGSFYGRVTKTTIDLGNYYNMIELDGDIVMIYERHLEIEKVGELKIVIS